MAARGTCLLVVLLQVWAPEAARVTAALHNAGARQQCTAAVAKPPSGGSLQSYFDGLRESSGILNQSARFGSGLVDPATCTKKDVCLLMRQLDMDFYARAREGTLTDHDYDTPPTLGWFKKGKCAGDMSRGYRVVPVEWADQCRQEAKKEGAGDMRQVNSSKLPTGCVIEHNKDAGVKKAYLNIMETDIEAGISYSGSSRVPKQVMQLCQMDRSLSEAAAAYYSPYKLKPSMEGNEARSTSCSFGIMAFLARLRETMSPCAKIISYKTDPRFYSAEHALQVASALEKKGPRTAPAVNAIRQYVETVRQKYVLLETISKQWCPGVWTAAKAKPGATCDAPRVMSWTEEGVKLAASPGKGQSAAASGGKGNGRKGGRQAADGKGFEQAGNQALLDDLSALLEELTKEDDTLAQGLADHNDPDKADKGRLDDSGKPIKIALTDESCEAFEDESLSARLRAAPQAPPDFFRDAALSED